MLITNQISVIVIILSIYLILLQHKMFALCFLFCHFVILFACALVFAKPDIATMWFT